MEKKNIGQVTQNIIHSLEEAGVVKPGNLQAVKLVLDMRLSKLIPRFPPKLARGRLVPSSFLHKKNVPA